MKWINRLRRGVTAGGFRTSDVDLAINWPTCAVGEKATVLGYDVRKLRGKDVPLHIRRLGHKFDLAVEDNNVALAFSIYTRIQEWE